MAISFIFTLRAYGKLHDGRRVTNVAKNKKDAYDNVCAIYPGYTIEEV